MFTEILVPLSILIKSESFLVNEAEDATYEPNI